VSPAAGSARTIAPTSKGVARPGATGQLAPVATTLTATPAVLKMTQPAAAIAATTTAVTAAGKMAVHNLASILADTLTDSNPLPLLAFAGYRTVASRTESSMTSAPTAATVVTGAAPPASATAPANVVGVIAVPGGNVSTQQTADGSRTIVTTRSTDDTTGTTTYFVSVVNTATGTQVGNTFTATTPPRGPMSVGPNPIVQLLGDDKRAVITTPQGSATMLTTIDTGTGAVMSTNSVAGNYLSTIAPVGDGRIVMITTTDGDGMVTKPTASYISFMDTATGNAVGTTTGLPGTAQPVRFTADGSRAIVESRTGGTILQPDYMSTVAVFDTATGQQVGSAIQGKNLQAAVSGNHAVVTTYQPTGRVDSSSWGSRPISEPQITFLNLATGQRVSDTMTYPSGSATTEATTRVSENGLLATVTTVYHSTTPNTGPDRVFRPYIWHSTTMVETFNTETGQQVGETFTAGDAAATDTWLRSDGGLAIITTRADSDNSVTTSFISTTTGHQVGYATGAPQFTADNTGLIVTRASTDTNTSHVAIFDLTTAERLSDTDIAGTLTSSQLTADGTRAIITISTDAGTMRTAVFDLTTGQRLGTADFAGTGRPQLSSDSTRAVVATTSAGTTHVTVINLVTGQQLGTTDVPGDQGTVALTAGDRAIVSAVDTGAPDTTRVVVINTATGQQLGTATSLTNLVSRTLTADSTRVILTGAEHDPETGHTTTRIVVLNTGTGGRLADFTVGGTSTAAMTLNADKTRAIITATEYDAVTGQPVTSAVTVLNVTTGQRVNAFTVDQGGIAATQFATNGNRAILTTGSTDSATGPHTTTVTVLDTDTGQQVGSISVDQATAEFVGVDLTPDGSRALIKTQTRDPDTGIYATQLTVLDTNVKASGSINNAPGNLLTRAFTQLSSQVTHFVTQVRAQITAAVIKAVQTLTGSNQPGSSQPGTPQNPGSGDDLEERWEAFNLYVGWLPGVGTFLSGVSLAIDTADLIDALNRGDTDEALDEWGDITGDLIGLVPLARPVSHLIGKPIAGEIRKSVEPALGYAGAVAGKAVEEFGHVVEGAVNGVIEFLEDTATNVSNTFNGFTSWLGSLVR